MNAATYSEACEYAGQYRHNTKWRLGILVHEEKEIQQALRIPRDNFKLRSVIDYYAIFVWWEKCQVEFVGYLWTKHKKFNAASGNTTISIFLPSTYGPGDVVQILPKTPSEIKVFIDSCILPDCRLVL